MLNISACLGSLIASKLIGIKSVGIVTDMPGLMVGGSRSFLSNLITRINKSYLGSFDYYVFLTEQMNPILNIHKRPYIVMEGFMLYIFLFFFFIRITSQMYLGDKY